MTTRMTTIEYVPVSLNDLLQMVVVSNDHFGTNDHFMKLRNLPLPCKGSTVSCCKEIMLTSMLFTDMIPQLIDLQPFSLSDSIPFANVMLSLETLPPDDHGTVRHSAGQGVVESIGNAKPK